MCSAPSPLNPPPLPNPPDPAQTPLPLDPPAPEPSCHGRQGGQGRIDDITGKGLHTAVALSTASCSLRPLPFSSTGLVCITDFPHVFRMVGGQRPEMEKSLLSADLGCHDFRKWFVFVWPTGVLQGKTCCNWPWRFSGKSAVSHWMRQALRPRTGEFALRPLSHWKCHALYQWKTKATALFFAKQRARSESVAQREKLQDSSACPDPNPHQQVREGGGAKAGAPPICNPCPPNPRPLWTKPPLHQTLLWTMIPS